MNPVFTALQNMTGGLVTDATTLVIGILVCGFLMMGFQMFMENLGLSSLHRRSKHYSDSADLWLDARNNSVKGTRKWDEADMSYKIALRESVLSNLKAGRL